MHLQRDDWPIGLDWWCDEAVDHSWYYGGDGSLRNGNQVVAKSQVLTRQRRAIAPVSIAGDGDEETDGAEELAFGAVGLAGREGMLEEDYFEPFIPYIRVRETHGRLCSVLDSV